MSGTSLDAAQAEALLRELDRQCAANGIDARVTVVGGAAMLALRDVGRVG